MKYIALLSCGCCETEMNFNSKENAVQTFNKAGLSSNATIVDDNNEIHKGVDTFYGFWTEDEEAHNLSWLADRVLSDG